MSQTIYASFADPANAEKAAGALLDYGVRQEDLSVVANEKYTWSEAQRVGDTPSSGRLGGETRGAVLDRPTDSAGYRESRIGDPFYSDVTDINTTDRITVVETDVDIIDRPDNTESAAKHGFSTTTAADAGAGAATGAEIGLGLGVLAGIASIAFVPGVGTLLGAGLLSQAIGLAVAGAAGTTAAGAIAGGVTGYLKDQGVDSHVAEKYNDVVTGGGAILAVTLPSNNVDVATGEMVLAKYGANNISNY